MSRLQKRALIRCADTHILWSRSVPFSHSRWSCRRTSSLSVNCCAPPSQANSARRWTTRLQCWNFCDWVRCLLTCCVWYTDYCPLLSGMLQKMRWFSASVCFSQRGQMPSMVKRGLCKWWRAARTCLHVRPMSLLWSTTSRSAFWNSCHHDSMHNGLSSRPTVL